MDDSMERGRDETGTGDQASGPPPSAAQAHKHVLHVVVGIDGGQEVLHLFELFGGQVGGAYRVVGLLDQVGRQHVEAVGGQRETHEVGVGGVGPEGGCAFFVACFKSLCTG